MSGSSTKNYVIKRHVNPDGKGGGYGVHRRDGQIISGHPTLEQAERAMMALVARDKYKEALRAKAVGKGFWL